MSLSRSTFLSKALPKILLFDDDPENLKLYTGMFTDHFHVDAFQNPFHFSKGLAHDTSAVLIDVLMPVMSGIELYKKLVVHPAYNGCPIVFITASKIEEVMLEAISTGGSEFLSRSMKSTEMILRVRNKIDNYHQNRTTFCLGDIRIDMTEPGCAFRNQNLPLTLIELKILKILIKTYPAVCERETINQEVWPGMKVMSTTVNTHVSNLRQKLMDWNYEILSIKNHGIQIIPKDSSR